MKTRAAIAFGAGKPLEIAEVDLEVRASPEGLEVEEEESFDFASRMGR